MSESSRKKTKVKNSESTVGYTIPTKKLSGLNTLSSFKIYPIKQYSGIKPKTAFNEEGTLMKVCELLEKNKGYHLRLHKHHNYIMFGDFDHLNSPITEFFDDFCNFLKDYYKILVDPKSISYTQNKGKVDKDGNKEGSYHFSIPTIYCSCKKIKEVIGNFKKIYSKQNDIYKKNYLDTSVYAEKWFRLPNQTCGTKGKESAHVIIKGDMKDFIVDYIPSNSQCIEDFLFIKNETKEITTKKTKPTKQSIKKVGKRIMNCLINTLNQLDHDKAKRYERWLNIGIIIYNETNGSDEGLELWVEYNKTHIPLSFNERECYDKWKTFSKRDDGLTIKTLKHYAKEDIGEKLILGRMNDLSCKISYFDVDEINHDNEVEARQFILDTVGYLRNGGSSFYITKNFRDGTIEFQDISKSSLLNDLSVYGNKIYNRLLNDSEFRKMITYDCKKFLPTNKENYRANKDKIFNTFTGFPVWNYEYEDEIDLTLILDHIKEILCKGRQDIYNFFLGWLAKIVQKPEEKTMVCVLMKSEQGAGKGSFWDWFCEDILGFNNSVSNTNIDKVLCKFNCLTLNKLLVICNETKNYSVAHSEAGQLKSLITDKRQTIEKKGCDPIEVDDFINIVICTNNNYSIKVTLDDRRFFCIEVDDKYCQNKEYFNKLYNVLDKKHAKAFYDFLMAYDWKTYFNPNSIPMTPYKKELMEVCKPLEQRFIEDIKNGEIQIHTTKGRIFITDLYDEFKIWIDNNGHKVKINKLNFKKGLEKYLNTKICRMKIGGVKKDGIILT